MKALLSLVLAAGLFSASTSHATGCVIKLMKERNRAIELAKTEREQKKSLAPINKSNSNDDLVNKHI